jgi:Mg/Co/Ni transporter MgtE
MKELKEAIDKLTEKVTSLEAELHVAQESLNEVQSIKPTNYDGIQKWITEEFAPDFMTKINESMTGNSNEEIVAELKNWVIEEFAPEVQNWVVEEFAPEVQNWVVEEFAPEVQNRVCEEFAPEVQNWIVEEFSPEIQNWITEEYSPEIQGWITEEFAPTMENWLMEEYTPEQSAIIEQKVNENVSAFMESQKAGRLDEIDGLLESIAAEGNTDVQQIVKEQNEENKYKGIYVVENMPAEYLPSWQLLDEAAQQSIIRSAKMYDFTKEGVLESFWANVDFSKKAEETKPVVESKNPIENYQNSVIANMKRLRGLNA